MKLMFIIMMAILMNVPFASAWAEEKLVYDGTVKFYVDKLPTFEEYPADEMAESQAEEIDWSSYPKAKFFRTRLSKGLKQGPNFAGKYVIISHGCGSPCQVNWVVNVETGKIIYKINTAHGVMYKKDSRLLIADLPFHFLNIDPEWSFAGPIRYYIILDDKLKLVETVDFPTHEILDAPKQPQ